MYASNRAQLLFFMSNPYSSGGAPSIANEYFGQTGKCSAGSAGGRRLVLGRTVPIERLAEQGDHLVAALRRGEAASRFGAGDEALHPLAIKTEVVDDAHRASADDHVDGAGVGPGARVVEHKAVARAKRAQRDPRTAVDPDRAAELHRSSAVHGRGINGGAVDHQVHRVERHLSSYLRLHLD